MQSPASGTFIVQSPKDILATCAKKRPGARLCDAARPGHHPRRDPGGPDFDTVQTQTRTVAARVDSMPDIIYGLPIARIVPQATKQLASPALAQQNNGPFPVDPTAKSGDVSLMPFFELDVVLPEGALSDRWGERVWLRFDHGGSPIAQRLYRGIRQVFLKRFNVRHARQQNAGYDGADRGPLAPQAHAVKAPAIDNLLVQLQAYASVLAAPFAQPARLGDGAAGDRAGRR